jgi:hypothetical protein
MHDIDRAMFEFEYESPGGMNETFGTLGNFGATPQTSEFEAAAELLNVRSEAELEQFLGDLISRAGSAVSSFAHSSTGKALGGLLKSAAKQYLPQIGKVLGGAIDPSLARAGADLGSFVGSKFELEGVSQEDREFETARSFVRFAQDAARRAEQEAESQPPALAAQQAAIAAAQQHAPALVGALSGARPHSQHLPHQGHWVRHGRQIVIHL